MLQWIKDTAAAIEEAAAKIGAAADSVTAVLTEVLAVVKRIESLLGILAVPRLPAMSSGFMQPAGPYTTPSLPIYTGDVPSYLKPEIWCDGKSIDVIQD